MLAMKLWYPWIVLAMTAQSQSTAEEKSRGDEYRGGRCLYVALEAMGLAPESCELLEEQLGDPTPAGYSMARLAEIAEARGAKTLAVETSLENLLWRRERFACLTIVNANRYVLLYDVDEDDVSVCDPPGLYKVNAEVFKLRWGRKALLIGPETFESEESITGQRRRRAWIETGSIVLLAIVLFGAGVMLARRLIAKRRFASGASVVIPLLAGLLGAASGCGDGSAATVSTGASTATGPLSAQPPEHRLGNLRLQRHGETVVVKTGLSNIGVGPVRIRSISSSCGRTVVRLGRSPSKPGEADFVHHRRVLVAPKLGAWTGSLTVKTTLGECPKIAVTALRKDAPGINGGSPCAVV